MQFNMTDRLAKVIPNNAAVSALKSLGIESIEDLLSYYPRKVTDAPCIRKIYDLQDGDSATVFGEVTNVKIQYAGKVPNRVEVFFTDNTSDARATFFIKNLNTAKWLESKYKVGQHIAVRGNVGYYGGYSFSHPEIEVFKNDPTEAERAKYLLPIVIYHATRRISTDRIHAVIATVIKALDSLSVQNVIPDTIIAARGLYSRYDAFCKVHFPRSLKEYEKAIETLKFEEAFLLQSSAIYRRQQLAVKATIPRMKKSKNSEVDMLKSSLKYTLTGAQERAVIEISALLSAKQPMQALLQGDVGSGKTIVALLAMLQVADSGGQSVLVAPTEVLALQHKESIERELGREVSLLTGSMTAAQKRKILSGISDGSQKILVGTHAVFSKDVDFCDLGLIIIDEQHRFGVHQRAILQSKAETEPHLLVMTATPIPRTLAMSIFADLDVITLDEMPANRHDIKTFVVHTDNKTWTRRMYQRVREEIDSGGKAFIVCPKISDDESAAGGDGMLSQREVKWQNTANKDFHLFSANFLQYASSNANLSLSSVEETDLTETNEKTENVLDDISEKNSYNAYLEAQETASYEFETSKKKLSEDADDTRISSVEHVYNELTENALFEGIEIVKMHGKLSAQEKEEAFGKFKAGNAKIMVSTTVVEVGIDVSDASCIVIMDADRFGLSTLHQLRGRVGRGERNSICFLVTKIPESLIDIDGTPVKPIAVERLSAMEKSNNGFDLALYDLAIRGEGDITSGAQSGINSSLKLIKIVRDRDLIATARSLAREIITSDKELSAHPVLRMAILNHVMSKEFIIQY
ncbi:MAG: ATP-dependent DNA helicase RecG [Bifidobacteriaceae bacterium]|jgi:ATP-dependent DNA helicase RecG|nr:ATP-dependent DNA helicase RecG [Bifidobacteriaceae bacterium]